MNSLTTEQKARVLDLYPSKTALIYTGSKNEDLEYAGKRSNNWRLARMMYAKKPDWKLVLRPLSAITDEDATWVAKLGCSSSVNPDLFARMGRELLDDYLKSGRCNVWGFDWMLIMQFLAQQGYAVPLFIAPGHEDNGKDAIALGLAVAAE